MKADHSSGKTEGAPGCYGRDAVRLQPWANRRRLPVAGMKKVVKKIEGLGQWLMWFQRFQTCFYMFLPFIQRSVFPLWFPLMPALGRWWWWWWWCVLLLLCRCFAWSFPLNPNLALISSNLQGYCRSGPRDTVLSTAEPCDGRKDEVAVICCVFWKLDGVESQISWQF